MSTSSSTLCPNCCALLEVLRFVIQIWYAISYILHCIIYSRELGIVHSKRSISLENTKGIKNYFLSFLSIITYVSFTFLSLSLSLSFLVVRVLPLMMLATQHRNRSPREMIQPYSIQILDFTPRVPRDCCQGILIQSLLRTYRHLRTL